MNHETTIILILLILNLSILFGICLLAGRIAELKKVFKHDFLEIRKKQIEIGSKFEAIADLYASLTEPLDNMDKNVSDLVNMLEDTHLKMLYAYNEIAKMKVHGKHIKKETSSSDTETAVKEGKTENEQY